MTAAAVVLFAVVAVGFPLHIRHVRKLRAERDTLAGQLRWWGAEK